MPYAFLSDAHLERYGRYSNNPTPEQLSEAFYLREGDLKVISTLRHDHTRLGYAVQLCTLRFLGTFLTDPTDVPSLVVQTLCHQLGLKDPRVLPRYLEREPTRFAHQRQIRKRLGYKEFVGAEVLNLLRWLVSSVQLEETRPIELFDRCTQRLVARKVTLPGATVLVRLIVKVRERGAGQLYRQLEAQLNPTHKDALEQFVTVLEGDTRTPLEQLRDPPDRISTPALLAALERVKRTRTLGVGDIPLTSFPESRLLALVRHADSASAYSLSRLSSARRYSTLLVYVQHLEKSATDDALLLFEALMNSLGTLSERKRRQERLRSLKDLDEAALALRDIARVVLDDKVADSDVRKVALDQVNRDRLTALVIVVGELAIPPGQALSESWHHALGAVGRVLVPLLNTLTFGGSPTAKPLLTAMRFLTQEEGNRRRSWRSAPKDFIPKSWEDAVYPQSGEPDKATYLLCVAHRLYAALKGREIFVQKSHKYSDPRGQLLTPEAWLGVKGDVCRSLNLEEEVTPFLTSLEIQLETQYQATLEGLPANSDVRLEEKEGRTTLTLKPLEKLPISESLKQLDKEFESRLPNIDLPEILLELDAATGCLGDFHLASEGGTRSEDIHLSIAAVLVAQACNIGLKAVSQCRMSKILRLLVLPKVMCKGPRAVKNTRHDGLWNGSSP